MKHLLPFFTFLSVTNIFSQTTNIPDENFEQVLIELSLDQLPANGSVSTAIVNTVTKLNFTDKNITNLEVLKVLLNWTLCFVLIII